MRPIRSQEIKNLMGETSPGKKTQVEQFTANTHAAYEAWRLLTCELSTAARLSKASWSARPLRYSSMDCTWPLIPDRACRAGEQRCSCIAHASLAFPPSERTITHPQVFKRQAEGGLLRDQHHALTRSSWPTMAAAAPPLLLSSPLTSCNCDCAERSCSCDVWRRWAACFCSCCSSVTSASSCMQSTTPQASQCAPSRGRVVRWPTAQRTCQRSKQPACQLLTILKHS